MKQSIIYYILFLSSFHFLLAQETNDNPKENSSNSKKAIESQQTVEGEVIFSDGTNSLIRITDEGTFGAIEINSGTPSSTTNKLYNVGGILKFNGLDIGSESGATSIDQLSDAKTGPRSVFLGSGSGALDNLQHNNNTAVGYVALQYNTAINNTAVGAYSLQNNSTGNENSAFGSKSLQKNTTGSGNTSFGYWALTNNTTSSGNTAVGSRALNKNTDGWNNTAIGKYVLTNNTTGIWNTGLGTYALNENSTGNKNTAAGYYSLYDNTTGSSNVAIGAYSLRMNTDRSNLVAIGDSALFNNGTGPTGAVFSIKNTAVGSKSLFSNISGYANTAVGYQTLYSNIGGINNTAFGTQALYSNTEGDRNTATGNNSLYNNTTGENNTVTGHEALYSNTVGSFNSAHGNRALRNNIDGNSNTANGMDVMYYNTSGSYNTANGKYALMNNSTGNNNTGSGYYALSNNETGDNNTAFGYRAGPVFGSTNLTNTTCIGYDAQVSQSNHIRLGNSSVTKIGGSVGWSILSDGRYKKNIKENVVGLKFILGLRAVTYNMDITALINKSKKTLATESEDEREARLRKEKIRYTGFIAQEVEELANNVGYDFSGINIPENENGEYSLRYSEFVVPLVKAVQEQQKIIDELKKEIEELKRQY